ncbi:T9SS type A sorting domain-containing protein [Pedobacter sp. SL55]|uniref:T9SS type A sorting domain-containing protein n=1 Tax=Pedobacter sp. SL55 TaxID=2995161 RepID=UPI0022716D70|nr:T9SS type A sorting domain-containing protein [Pedobacter sp. SL55]WAC39491.1 T9SS type A sorting domain-containing protein [Pedobacter sp. SL55]
MKKFLSFLALLFVGFMPIAIQAQTVSTFVSSGLNKPAGLATDAAGNIYVADEQGNQVLKYTPLGVKTVVASPVGGYQLPNGVAVDADNNIYVSTNHFDQHTVFKVTPANVVTEVEPGLISGPVGVAVDGDNNLYVADFNVNTVRKITPAGVASVFTTQVEFPVALTVDGSGNVYVIGGNDSEVHKFNAAGTLLTSFNGFNYPSGIAVDASDNVFVADTYGHRIAKITPAGVVTNYAGSEGIADHVDGPLADAYFTEPFGIAIDANDQIYISEFSPNQIRKITPATLPVTLISYTAQVEDNYTLLKWRTESEQNNKQFIIYRSGDDKDFKELKRMDVVLNSSNIKNYSYTDKTPLNGNNYYKLVQLDADGKVNELGVRVIAFNLNTESVKLYPNPTANKAIVTFMASKYLTASISDINGRILQTQNLAAQQTEVEIDLSSFPKGLYFVKLSGANGTLTSKLVKK